eukprot:g4621.t1
MSSLAASQADGYYHPPSWDPRRQSRRAMSNSKGSNQWEQRGLVRFEMPFDVWCLGCERATRDEVQRGTAYRTGYQQHIGRGVRFDARKVADGKYHSTTIWRFEMKCHLCYRPIVVRTDPKNGDYELVAGARRKEKGYTAKSAGVIELRDEATKERIATDTFFALETADADRRAAKRQRRGLEALVHAQSRARDDYALNRRARAHFRDACEHERERASAGAAHSDCSERTDAADSAAAADACASFAHRARAAARRAHEVGPRLGVLSQGVFGSADAQPTAACKTAFERGIRPELFRHADVAVGAATASAAAPTIPKLILRKRKAKATTKSG